METISNREICFPEETRIQTSTGEHLLLEPNIILVRVTKGTEFGVSELQESRDINQKLSNGEAYCVLLETAPFPDYTDEAKALSTTPEFTDGRFALAIIQNSLALRLLIRFYIKMNKPICPTRAFNSREEALIWLRQERDKQVKKRPA